jgi:5-methylcytosine-specific restriction protein A
LANFERRLNKLKVQETERKKMSVAGHAQIRQGDRVFLMRLGEEPKVIMSCGFVTSDGAFQCNHWNGKVCFIDYQVLLNHRKESLLDIDILENEENLKLVDWIPQSSEIKIDSEVANQLECI